MLNRIDLYSYFGSSQRLKSEPAVKIQGAMMKSIPSEYAEKLHISGYHPYSVYVIPYGSGYIIRVSVMNEDAMEIIRGMSSLNEIKLYGTGEAILITDRKPYEPLPAEKLGSELTGRGCRIEFLTPAMIKTGGRPCAKPDVPAYFYSVIQKYNAFENAAVSYEAFLEAFSASVMEDYELKSAKYNVSGHIFPGMVGYCDIIFPRDSEQSSLLKRIFSYAEYSGVGGKTGMGMGAFGVQSL